MSATIQNVASYIQPSHHVCYIYNTYEEILSLVVEFCIDGIKQNYSVICNLTDQFAEDNFRQGIYDLQKCKPDHTFLKSAQVREQLEKRGVDVEQLIQRNQLLLVEENGMYFDSGSFDCDKGISFFTKALAEAKEAGFAGIRGLGDMSFAYGYFGDQSAKLFAELESKICSIQKESPEFTAICCFDRNLFPSSVIKAAIQTHPIVAVNDKFYTSNFYFIPPDKIIDSESLDDDVLECWINNLNEKKIYDDHMAESLLESQKQFSDLRTSMHNQITTQKDSIISNISHEIRTPLTGILGGIDLLASTMVSEEQQKLLRVLLPSVQQLSRVLSDILTLDEEIVLKSQPFSLFELVENSIIESKAVCAVNIGLGEQLKITTTYDSSLPAIMNGDEMRIQQVLVNLISNAIKFSNENVVVNISIYALQYIDDNIELKFCIVDNGIGLAAGDSQKIFSTFWQHDQSATKKYSGTGLGLAITKALIKLMGGDITANSAGINRGTVVEFTVWAKLEQANYNSPQMKHILRSTSDVKPLPPEIETNILHIINNDQITDNQITNVQITDNQIINVQITINDLKENETTNNHIAKKQTENNRTDHKPNNQPTNNQPTNSQADQITKTQTTDSLSMKPRTPSPLLPRPTTPPPSLSPLSSLSSKFLVEPSQKSFLTVPAGCSVNIQSSNMSVLPKNISILLVEDNIINAKIIVQLLLGLGYQAKVARNGVEAVTAASKLLFDVIFMDLHMPIMDGFQATQKIMDSLSPKPMIFALTASTSEADKRRCEHAGMVGHLAKPVSKLALQRALNLVGNNNNNNNSNINTSR